MLATDKKSKNKKEKIKEKIPESNIEVDEEPVKKSSESIICFCSVCNTVYYPKIEDDDLILICRNCGNKEKSNNHIVHRNDYKSDYVEVNPEDILNEYLKYDCSLPRTRKVTCPECNSNHALFFKYNNNDMALLYLCLNEGCNHYWIK